MDSSESPLNERLDEAGGFESPEGRYMAMFRWIQQATVEIDRLRNDVERLEREALDADA